MEISKPSKNEIKFVKSLAIKKYRYKNASFIVEGLKSVQEFVHSGTKVQRIYLTSNLIGQLNFDMYTYECKIIDENSFKQLSEQNTPSGILAIVEMPKVELNKVEMEKGCTLILDNVQDPGNLGTLIRLADWFGIKQVICSIGTVDCYNPKTVQATMGSLCRVAVFYKNLLDLMKDQKKIKKYSAVLGGQNLYKTKVEAPCFLILGNEANGINVDLKAFRNCGIEIPKMGKAESLNVAIAGGIILSEFYRQFINH